MFIPAVHTADYLLVTGQFTGPGYLLLQHIHSRVKPVQAYGRLHQPLVNPIHAPDMGELMQKYIICPVRRKISRHDDNRGQQPHCHRRRKDAADHQPRSPVQAADTAGFLQRCAIGLQPPITGNSQGFISLIQPGCGPVIPYPSSHQQSGHRQPQCKEKQIQPRGLCGIGLCGISFCGISHRESHLLHISCFRQSLRPRSRTHSHNRFRLSRRISAAGTSIHPGIKIPPVRQKAGGHPAA